MGQVRVHPSKRSGSIKKKTRFNNCCFFRNPFLQLNSIKLKGFRPILPFWVSVFSCGSDNFRPDSAQNGSKSNGFEQEDEDIEERENGIGASASTPPKNALLLTRCRSAPYTCRLLCSPLRTKEERETGVQKTEQETTETPALDTESCGAGRGLVVKSRGDSEGGNNREEGRGNRAAIDEGLKERPPLMMLMRCRSEPTRRGSEKLDPLTSKFWLREC